MLCHSWFTQWLVAWAVPTHCLNQCWNIVNWTLWTNFSDILIEIQIFIEENAFENVVWELPATLARSQCVKLSLADGNHMMWYRNWYQYWSRCCLINDLPEGFGELPRSLPRQQWPKLRYQFLFYHDETKLIMNKHILSIWMLKFVPKLSMVTAWLHVHILGSCDLTVSPW